jgi:dTDP-4-amino-4,6-dideoxygalactose transaminase
LKSLNLPENSEVILPAMTFISTLLAVVNNNLKPVLVDIVKDTSLISIEDIKKKINSKTKVILPVHLYGSVVDIRKIKKIIKNKNIYIIDDAAQAHGAKNADNKKVGSLSDISCFSFYPGKNLGCYGDGGIVTTNSEFIYRKIRKLRNLGSDKKYIHDEIGINSRFDSIQASILLNKINQLNFFNKKRNKIAKYYDNFIINIKINKIKYSKNSVYHQYVIMTKNRNLLIKKLKKSKIPFGIHYPKPLHKLDCFKNIFKRKKFPNSEKLSNSCLSLPIDPNLTKNEIKKIVKVLNSF